MELRATNVSTTMAPPSAFETRVQLGAATYESVTLREAREEYAWKRSHFGLARVPGQWWTAPDANLKLALAAAGADPTYAAGLTLIPASGFAAVVAASQNYAIPDSLRLVGAHKLGTLCTHSTPTCRRNCVITGGRGAMPTAVRGRAARTLLWWYHPAAAMRLDIDAAERHDRRYGPAARRRWCIGDDVRWSLFMPESELTRFEGRQYQYTKHSVTDLPERDGHVIVRSATGERGRWTIDSIRAAAQDGQRIAVVCDAAKTDNLPATWAGIPAIDGDATDDRTLQPAGTICLLRAKGSLRGTVGKRSGSFVFPTYL